MATVTVGGRLSRAASPAFGAKSSTAKLRGFRSGRTTRQPRMYIGFPGHVVELRPFLSVAAIAKVASEQASARMHARIVLRIRWIVRSRGRGPDLKLSGVEDVKDCWSSEHWRSPRFRPRILQNPNNPILAPRPQSLRMLRSLHAPRLLRILEAGGPRYLRYLWSRYQGPDAIDVPPPHTRRNLRTLFNPSPPPPTSKLSSASKTSRSGESLEALGG